MINKGLERGIRKLIGKVGTPGQRIFKMIRVSEAKHTKRFFSLALAGRTNCSFRHLLASHNGEEILAVLAHGQGIGEKAYLSMLVLIEILSFVSFMAVSNF